jgi:hypothetical protein
VTIEGDGAYGLWSLWSLDDAAGVPRGTCHRLRRDGKLTEAVRIGQGYYVREEDIPRLSGVIIRTMQTSGREDGWVSVAYAAELSDRSPSTIYTLVQRGTLKSRRVGKRLDVDRAYLVQYMARVSKYARKK